MNRSNQDLCLLLSDDALLLRNLQQVVKGRAQILPCARSADLLSAPHKQVRAVVVDGVMLQADDTRELAQLRSAFPLAHILLIATSSQLRWLNDVQPLRIEMVMRPLLPQVTLSVLIDRCLSAGRLSDLQMQTWIKEMASECRLTRRDLALMPLVLDAETPEQTRARLGMDQAGLERSLRRLVKKCRVRNTDRLAKNLMRDALLFSREHTSHLIEPSTDRAAAF
jgi:DNA-binding NarL/FixJ family response regulator